MGRTTFLPALAAERWPWPTLGDGKRLTAAVGTDASLKLTSARPVSGGVAELVYSVA